MKNIKIIITTTATLLLLLSLTINYLFYIGFINLNQQQEIAKDDWSAIYAEAEKYNKKGK